VQLKTYPRLNLPTKRWGIAVEDWLLILGSFLPGLLVSNFNDFFGIILVIIIPMVTIIWASIIKPSKPRGWLSGVFDYLLRNGMGIRQVIHKAELEPYDGPSTPRR